MIVNDQELKATQERIAQFQQRRNRRDDALVSPVLQIKRPDRRNRPDDQTDATDAINAMTARTP